MEVLYGGGGGGGGVWLTDKFLLLVLTARLGEALTELHAHWVQTLQHSLLPLTLIMISWIGVFTWGLEEKFELKIGQGSSPAPWQYMQVAPSLFQNAAPAEGLSIYVGSSSVKDSPGSTFQDLCFSSNGKHSFSAWNPNVRNVGKIQAVTDEPFWQCKRWY